VTVSLSRRTLLHGVSLLVSLVWFGLGWFGLVWFGWLVGWLVLQSYILSMILKSSGGRTAQEVGKSETGRQEYRFIFSKYESKFTGL
jgi:hypothetical protein